MKQLFLGLSEPVIGSLLLINFIVLGCIFISLVESKKPIQALEKIFLVVFLTIMTGSVIFPFNRLNPHSLALAQTKLISFTVISQISFYSLVVFLLRSQLRCLYPSIYFLLKTPFLSGLILLTVLSGFWSETPDVTFKASLVLLVLSIIASYTAFRYSFDEIGRILRWTGTLMAIAGTCVSILVPSIGTTLGKDGGWNGILTHPNPFGAWMAFTSALWCLNAITSSKHRWLSVSLSILSLFVLLRTHSGASIPVFLTMFSILGVFKICRYLKFKQAIITLIFTVILSVFLVILISVGKEFILGLIGRDATLTGRTDFWPEVIKSILKRPILGYGYGGFWQSWRGADSPAAHIINPNGFVPPHSHNGYLELALSLGASGIILFFLSFVSNLVRIPFSRNSEAEISILMLIFILMPNLSESTLWETTQVTFLYVFLSVRLNVDVAKEKSKNARTKQLSYSS